MSTRISSLHLQVGNDVQLHEPWYARFSMFILDLCCGTTTNDEISLYHGTYVVQC